MRSRLAVRFLNGLSQCLLWTGAGLTLTGALSAWAQVTLLRHIAVFLPGLLFTGGGICLAIAVLILLGARRLPLLCFIGAVGILAQTHQAAHDIPPRIKYQLIGAQLAATPLNRLLDQFQIQNLEVANWNAPDAQILGNGLSWTTTGGEILLFGAFLGLPSDPALRWAFSRTRCRRCGTRWPRARRPRYCPHCGENADPDAPRLCRHCHMAATPSDCYCIACGIELNEIPYSLQ